MRIIHVFIGATLPLWKININFSLHLNMRYVYIENTKNVWIYVLEIKKMIACLKRMHRNCFDYLKFVVDIRGGKRRTGNKL